MNFSALATVPLLPRRDDPGDVISYPFLVPRVSRPHTHIHTPRDLTCTHPRDRVSLATVRTRSLAQQLLDFGHSLHLRWPPPPPHCLSSDRGPFLSIEIVLSVRVFGPRDEWTLKDNRNFSTVSVSPPRLITLPPPIPLCYVVSTYRAHYHLAYPSALPRPVVIVRRLHHYTARATRPFIKIHFPYRARLGCSGRTTSAPV